MARVYQAKEGQPLSLGSLGRFGGLGVDVGSLPSRGWLDSLDKPNTALKGKITSGEKNFLEQIAEALAWGRKPMRIERTLLGSKLRNGSLSRSG